MFRYVGKTLQRLAKIWFFVGVFGGLATGIVWLIVDFGWLGWVITLGVPFVAATAAWTLFGIGEVVENAERQMNLDYFK